MRTRFAPSPTGFLHVGGLRTALFSYLLAKKAGGSFSLRIEDTDQSREVAGATLNILKTLEWAGIPPDEGVILKNGTIAEQGDFGPYFQSKRLPIYQKYVEQLLQAGHAYRCFCSKERLEEMRKKQEAMHRAPMYDRACLKLPTDEIERRAKTEPHAIRMLIPSGEQIVCDDHIRGKVNFATNTLDDQVILKSDGFPTYHLAHVVDDHLMETSLVVRGEEWLPSLPKHLLLFKFLGWQPPEYAHVPLLLAKGGGKLSKRQGDVSVEAFMERGYLPEAVVNFIALLGWNPGTSRAPHDGTGQRPEKEQEIFSLEELIEKFSLERVQKAGAIFDTTKLDWLQGQWMRKLPLAVFTERIRPLVEGTFKAAGEDPTFTRKAELIQGRITFFSEAPEMLRYFYEEPKVDSVLLVNEKQGVTREDLPRFLTLVQEELGNVPEDQWTQENLQSVLFGLIEKHNLKKGQLLWPLRVALTGLPYSPGAFEVAAVLGKEKTLERLKKCQMNKTPSSNSSKMIEFQGQSYFDDRLFVLFLCEGKVDDKPDSDGVVWTTIFHEQAPADHIWCVVTYKNCVGYPIAGVKHFTSRDRAVVYMWDIEPETPLISLNGSSPSHPTSHEEYSSWKKTNGFREYDFQTVFTPGGKNAREIIGQTKEQFKGVT